MQKSLYAVAVLALLAGCVHVTEIKGPDGRIAHVLDCGNNRANCLRKAGELCPTGYQVIDDATNQVANRYVMAADITLTVSCK